ncbi:XRE family transcriptional regulator [Chitinophaga parva]|uniref:XRE family transcriptional regulator n=1 Tax=Chitinophaga parva TaxID=2169414 RepID=A0A2T7BBS2_9BACT|nr:helix-turn-helix domain-containing protein [Chitinophaga parva]PUZ21823.1 XRE family transcriptional regulator [Chitinophaga parva]
MESPSHLRHIGAMVKQAREYRGLSQEKLAENAALRRATIVDIELGKTNFEINTLVRIASALNFYLDVNLTPAD